MEFYSSQHQYYLYLIVSRYITVAEIKGNFRNTILIPESGWDDFRDVLDDYVKQCKEHD